MIDEKMLYVKEKGQIGFEYYFALIAFVAVVSYIFFRLVSYYPGYFSYANSEIVRANTYQISEILINDPGYPIDWENGGEIKRIGLNSELFNKSGLISLAKAKEFNEMCNNDFDSIKKYLDIKNGMKISLVDNSSNLIISCDKPSGSSHPFTLTRIVSIYNETNNKITYGELMVSLD